MHTANEIYTASLSHSTLNLGDEIQTLAADRFVDHVDARFDRDHLRYIVSDQKYILILNGWFSHSVKTCFPPAGCFEPVIISFHIDKRSRDYFLTPECITYFKRHEPIGCRDVQTMQWLKKEGVNAYFSKCLTLTLPTRKHDPVHPEVIIVDLPSRIIRMIPRRLRLNAVFRTHTPSPDDQDKMQSAKDLLEYYQEHACLVITGRLHCALPCLAMGIPVVLFGDPHDYRLSVAQSCGIRIHRIFLLARSLKVTGGPIRGRIRKLVFFIDTILLTLWYKWIHASIWAPGIVDLRKEKETLLNTLTREYSNALRRYMDEKRNA